MADRPLPVAKPVERSTLSQQVRDQLTSWIVGGELAPGDPLPSERVLSDQFGVARTSIREAIQGLLSTGLVERRGNRSYVTEHLPDLVVEADSRKDFVRELFETRRVLELPILELAAERASQAERDEIHALAERFGAELSLDEFRELDRQFHTLTARACGNPLLVEVHGKVLEALFTSSDFDSLLYDSANTTKVATIVAEASREHRAIAAALAAQDQPAVVAAAEAHLTNIEQRMLKDLI